MTKSKSLLVFFGLLFSLVVQAAAYDELNFKTLYFEIPKRAEFTEQYRVQEFIKMSRARLESFEQDTEGIATNVSLKSLKKLNEDFHMSEIIGEGSDAVLPLELRNTICYVRAMWVHMKLLLLGVPDSAIRKVVLEGYINHESIGYAWAYHIVTAVKAGSGEWYVFDLEYPELMSLQEWFDKMQEVQTIGSSKRSPYQFLFAVRPSRQYTLVDDHYGLTIGLEPEVDDYIKTTMEMDKEFGARLKNYIGAQ